MTPAKKAALAPLVLFLLACVVASLAISSQSFWVDEVQTALKAVPATPRGWWSALYAEHNQNMQMPLYMFYIWAWARLFGFSEIALRAANIPWFMVGFFAIAHFLRRRPGFRNAALLVFCVHPFVWYYLNEARPYIMQLAGAITIAGALFWALDQPGQPLRSSWWWLFGAGLTVLCGAGVLGVPWSGVVTLLLMTQPAFWQSLRRFGIPALLVFGPVLAALAIYFRWTVHQLADTGLDPMNPASIPFVFYEHLGFAGLGPGRTDIRSGGVALVLSWFPYLCILGIPLLYALAVAARSWFGVPRRLVIPVGLVVLLPTAFVFLLAIKNHYRVVGRHLTPLSAFVVAALAYAIYTLWNRRRALDRVILVWLLLALLLSSLECRFASRHAKDDYRDAASFGKAALARGENVWWVADRISSAYYGLPASPEIRPHAALALWSALPPDLASLQPPALIVLSKPDLFDRCFGVTAYIKQHGYTRVAAFPAFTVWHKPG